MHACEQPGAEAVDGCVGQVHEAVLAAAAERLRVDVQARLGVVRPCVGDGRLLGRAAVECRSGIAAFFVGPSAGREHHEERASREEDRPRPAEKSERLAGGGRGTKRELHGPPSFAIDRSTVLSPTMKTSLPCPDTE